MMDRFPINPSAFDHITMPSALLTALPSKPTGVCHFGAGKSGDLCFCDRTPVIGSASAPAGTFVLVPHALYGTVAAHSPESTCIPVDDARAYFIDLLETLIDGNWLSTGDAFGQHHVSNDAIFGQGTVIFPDTRIESGVRIGTNCSIGRGTWLKAGVRIEDNTVIGASGINSYTGVDGRTRSFPHCGGVIIGAGTHIGANCVIVRGILGHTVIGEKSVIGNMCNIGHGVQIGNEVWISVGGLIGGHTSIDDHVSAAMGVTIRDNLRIGARAQIGMGSVVVRNIEKDTSVFGNPARICSPLQAGPQR